jgi:hypothetical protein
MVYCDAVEVIPVIRSIRMIRVGHVARMGERRFAYRVNLREREHLENPGVDGRIILKWIFRKWDVRYGLN